jgi:GNAT superfamily N-acetyltransferase
MTDQPVQIKYRAASLDDASAILGIFNRAKAEAMPWLPKVHTDEEDRWWVANKLIPENDVTVALRDGEPVAFCALSKEMLEQLYVDPSAQRQGIGRRFVQVAKIKRPEGFRLYCFKQNEPAVEFYRSQGLVIVDEGDGSGNEEGLPDLLFEWRPDGIGFTASIL